MAEVTDADRETAREIVSLWDLTKPAGPLRLVDEISAAFAEERERVLAPFLALVSEYAGEALSEHFAGHTTAGDILRDICRAAEESA